MPRRVGLGVQVVTPTNVAQLQADVSANWGTLNNAIGICLSLGKLDTQTAGDWSLMSSRVQSFLAEDPSWISTAAQMNEGQAIQADLQPWYARIKALGCSVGPAPVTPSGGGSLSDLLGDVGKLLPWVVAIMVLREVHK